MDSRLSPSSIITQIKDAKRKNILVYPQHVPRASEIGHPCERYLVYSITNWSDRTPHGPEVEFIFEGGRLVEELAVKDLEDAGFKIYRPEPDKAIMESRPRITGHIDVRVDFGTGDIYTGEIKGLNVFDFDKLHSLDDFLNSKKPWIRKYPAQLMTYLYIKGEERGFFYLKSIPRFQPKLIWIDLNLDYMEQILQKTERIEKHVAEGTLPDRIDDFDICEYCAFSHICLPPVNRDAMEFIDDPDFEDKLNRRAELAPLVSEYNSLDREISRAVKGGGPENCGGGWYRLPDGRMIRGAEAAQNEYMKARSRLMVGDFVITGKWIERGGYRVKPSRYWKTKIVKVGSVANE